MAEPFTVYDVPRCSTSQKVLALLAAEAPGVEVRRIRYHDTGVDADELRGVLARAGLEPADVLRAKEPLARELGLPGDLGPDELVALMVAHPRLVERPLVVRGDRAVLARPVERARELF